MSSDTFQPDRCLQDVRDPQASSGMYFQWHFLEACNFKCQHCYQDDYSNEKPSIALLDSVYSQISTAVSTWKRSARVSLTGGEPFLYNDRLFYLLEKLEADPCFYWVGVLTNGSLIDKETANRLRKYSKLKEVQISFDGATADVHDVVRGMGAYSKALSGLHHLTNANISTAIMFTLNKKNCLHAAPIIQFAADNNVDAITVERYIPIGNTNDQALDLSAEEVREAYASVIEMKKKLTEKNLPVKVRTSRPLWHLVDKSSGGFCPVGFSSLTILHDGTVLPCRRIPIPIGNICNDGLFKIWYQSPILWDIRRKNRLKAGCLNCSEAHICGGCRAAAFANTGDYLEKDPHCWKQV